MAFACHGLHLRLCPYPKYTSTKGEDEHSLLKRNVREFIKFSTVAYRKRTASRAGMGENPGCFCSIVWRSFSTWIPWACHLNWLQDLLQFIAPLSSYFIRFIKHKLKSSRNTKGKRWERKNNIQVFLFLKTTWLLPWAGEVWGRILTVTDGPSPGLLVIPSHLWNPRARWEETTQKRSRVAQCNCHNSHTSPSCGNFVPKMVLNWAVRPARVTLLSEAEQREPHGRPSLHTISLRTVRNPFFWPSSSSTSPLSYGKGLALSASSWPPRNDLTSLWPSSCLLGITSTAVQKGFPEGYIPWLSTLTNVL